MIKLRDSSRSLWIIFSTYTSLSKILYIACRGDDFCIGIFFINIYSNAVLSNEAGSDILWLSNLRQCIFSCKYLTDNMLLNIISFVDGIMNWIKTSTFTSLAKFYASQLVRTSVIREKGFIGVENLLRNRFISASAYFDIICRNILQSFIFPAGFYSIDICSNKYTTIY